MTKPDEDAANSAIWDACHRQWKALLFMLLLIVVAGFSISLFGTWLPKSTVPPGNYFISLFMLAACGFAVGWSTVRVFDPESRQDHLDDIARAYAARFSPLAGLIGWFVGMAFWIRHLHGWTPETLAFFVVNPFGICMVPLVIGFLLLRLMALLSTEIVERRLRD